MIELLILLGWALVGLVILPSRDDSMPAVMHAALGFLSGAGVIVLIALVMLVAGLPTPPALIFVVAAGASVTVSLVRDRRVTVRPRAIVASLCLIGSVVAIYRTFHLVGFHWDSFRYLASAELLAASRLVTDGDVFLLETRLVSVPALHAFASLHGEMYLRALSPLVALCGVVALGWLLATGMRASLGRTAAMAVAGAAVLALLSINRFAYNAVYLNGHLLVATTLMVIVGIAWLENERPDLPSLPVLRAAQLALLPLLILARPETSVLALLAIAPTLTIASVPVRQRRALLITTGALVSLWHGWLWIRIAAEGAELTATVPLMTGLGLLAIAAAAIASWPPLTSSPVSLLIPAEIFLWMFLAAFALRDPSILRDSVLATVDNAILGEQSWGASLVILGLLGVIVWMVARGWPGTLLRFPVTTFVPLVLLAAYLRGSPYRVNPGDSLNRMLIHIVPLLVLYVAASATARWPRAGTGGADEARVVHETDHADPRSR